MQLSKNKTSTLFNALILTIGTVASKLLGFFREWIIAYKYGTGAISDAFTLTNSIPTMLFVSLATAISINYIPLCSECRDRQEKNEFTSNILSIATVIMLVGCAIIALFGEVVIYCFAPGINEETRAYAIIMLRIVTLSIFPIIYSNVFQGYSQTAGKFKMTSIYGMVTNVVMILFTVVSSSHTFYLLSLGYVFSYIFGMVICYAEAHRNEYRFHFFLDFREPRIKKIVLLTLPLMVEDVTASLSLVVDRILGSYLESGTLSALGYASTLGNIASTMIASAIITATYPVFSKLVADNQLQEFKNIFRKYALLISALLAPISAFMVFYAKEITIIIFEHGAFGSASSQIVWEAMACYALGIIPCGIQSYIVRAFYSLQETKTPVVIKVGALISNIGLNLLLVGRFKHMGIAVSTSISYLIAMVLLSVAFEKKFKMKVCSRLLYDMIRNTAIAFVVGMLVRYSIGRVIHINLINILISGIVYFVFYVFMFLILMNKEDRDMLISFVKKRVIK